MAGLNGFDASKVAPGGGFAPLPAGDYLAKIVASSVKATTRGDGKYLELQFLVTSGPHRGRRLWDRLNLWNRHPAAVHHAISRLSAICDAVGRSRPADSRELHDRPLALAVAVTRRRDSGALTNEITGFARAPAAPPPSGPYRWNAPAIPPWRRGPDSPAAQSQATREDA